MTATPHDATDLGPETGLMLFPGMAMLGVRVVATRSGRLSWPAAVLRALILAYFPIGAIWALVDRRRQAVHDKVARTAVVREPSSRRLPSVAP